MPNDLHVVTIARTKSIEEYPERKLTDARNSEEPQQPQLLD